MKILISQLLFTCFLFALYFSIRVYRKWNLHYRENRLFSGLCLASAIWSLGFWGVNIQEDPNKAYYCRCVGMVGTFAFLIIATLLILHLSIIPRIWKRIISGFSFTAVIIYFFLLKKDLVTYHMSSIGMTYSFNSSIWNDIYVIYTVILAVCMAASLICTLRRSQFEYIRLRTKKLLLAELLVVVGMILDTVFPLIGTPSFPGSTIGQFVGLIAMYDAISFINQSRINIGNMSKYVYSSLSLPVLVFNDKHKLQILNDAAFTFFEIDEITNQMTIESLFDLKEEDAFSFEGNRKDLDTVSIHNNVCCNLAINKIINDYEDLIGYIIIVTDLTERIKSFNELEEATREATYANQAKTTFLANMSHEIRTPMNAIIGFSELLLKSHLSQEERSYVEDILISSQNLLAIINDILDITKIESGKMVLITEDYYLMRLLDDISLIISQQAQKKGLDFHMKIDPNVPTKLHGDKIKIRGVLINILNNAVKYTKKGFVSFELSILEQSNDRIKIAFIIRDTGVGIRDEDMEKIFKSFERVDRNIHYKEEGSGLGLAIANAYVSMMGGEIKVSSEYGKGSVFTVILEQEVVDATIMKQNFTISRKRKESDDLGEFRIYDVNVLVVDDNYVNLRVAKGLLSSYGLTVSTAASGQDAVEMCRRTHYAIIFMDQMMPEVDGITAMKMIREMDPYYAPGGEGKIVVLTADAIRGVREQLMQQGFDEYIGKPMNMAQLERILLQYLPAEKIIYTVPTAKEPPTVDEDTEEANTAWLQEALPKVNVKKGIDLCGKNVQDYLMILKITYAHGEKHLAELVAYLEKGDYENYTIKIHSMKSTTMSIGAEMLSEMARLQEMAGKEERFQYIDDNFQDFKEKYMQLLADIQEVLCHFSLLPKPAEEESPLLQENVMRGILSNIRRCLDDFDFAAIFEIMEQVEKYRTNEKQKAFFTSLKTLMDNLSIEEIYPLLDSYEDDGTNR